MDQISYLPLLVTAILTGAGLVWADRRTVALIGFNPLPRKALVTTAACYGITGLVAARGASNDLSATVDDLSAFVGNLTTGVAAGSPLSLIGAGLMLVPVYFLLRAAGRDQRPAMVLSAATLGAVALVGFMAGHTAVLFLHSNFHDVLIGLLVVGGGFAAVGATPRMSASDEYLNDRVEQIYWREQNAEREIRDLKNHSN